MVPFRIVTHSKKVLSIAMREGWLPGARYTNLRDIRTFPKIGFLDIDWKQYNFERHLEAAKATKPFLTVARDLEDLDELDDILCQAELLSCYAKHVIIVPKDRRLSGKIDKFIPSKYILGFSVPTKYGGTKIHPKHFKRPTHLLGGRPDVQWELRKQLDVFSLDCNRFTLDAAFGDFFDGVRFRRHPKGGYERCIRESIRNINRLWESRARVKRS